MEGHSEQLSAPPITGNAEIVEIIVDDNSIQAPPPSPPREVQTPAATKRPAVMGGWKTVHFILAIEVLERMATTSIQANVTFYLKRQYHLPNTTVAIIVFMWNALSHFNSIFAGVAARFYGPFWVIVVSTTMSFLGFAVLASTHLFDSLRPPADCQDMRSGLCKEPKPWQLLLLSASFLLISTGTGGIRCCTQEFAAKQLDHNDSSPMSSFETYYACCRLPFSAIVVLFVLLLSVAASLNWDFLLLPVTAVMLLAILIFWSRSNRYVKRPPRQAGSMICRGKLINTSMWKVMIPTWSAGIFLAVTNTPGPFLALQANEMHRGSIIGYLQWPTSAYAMFAMVVSSLWVELYPRALIPMLKKLLPDRASNGVPSRYRIGIGLGLSCAANVVGGVVENQRRKKSIAMRTMPATWLIPQFCLVGLAEAFNHQGQLDFYKYECELPSGDGRTLLALGQALGSLMASGIIPVVKKLSLDGSTNASWLSDVLDVGHYDYHYCVLAILALANFASYLIITNWACVRNKVVGVVAKRIEAITLNNDNEIEQLDDDGVEAEVAPPEQEDEAVYTNNEDSIAPSEGDTATKIEDEKQDISLPETTNNVTDEVRDEESC